MIDITRENLESVLDNGNLFAAMKNGNWWRLRRNGKTQTWKRDPSRFRLPIKAGLRTTYALTETDFSGGKLNPADFRHADDLPNNKG